MSTPVNGIVFLPAALAQALTDFGALTRADQMVLVVQHGQSVTYVAIPGGDPQATSRMLDQAASLAQERVASLDAGPAPDKGGDG